MYLSIILYPANIVLVRLNLASLAWQVHRHSLRVSSLALVGDTSNSLRLIVTLSYVAVVWIRIHVVFDSGSGPLK